MGKTAPDDVLREDDIAPINSAHHPAPGIIAGRFVVMAFDWFAAQSFTEIHPVEQAALVYVRLLDLQPFNVENEQVALLAASFYIERAGWPPLIIYADEAAAARYTTAIDAAFRMLTQPLVEFFAESLARTIKQITGTEG
jgi:Fic family protein